MKILGYANDPERNKCEDMKPGSIVKEHVLTLLIFQPDAWSV